MTKGYSLEVPATEAIEKAVPRFKGKLGEELTVLSRSEIRAAERATEQMTVVTADGPIDARPGDFIVSMPSGERFPISADTYFGAYEVLSSIGDWYVGRRLIHRRRAWPVVSSAAEFDYGPDRGSVIVDRGSWLYQSDETEYGMINSTAAITSHKLVCPASVVERTNWARVVRWTDNTLCLLPVVLIALGVSAIGIQGGFPNISMWLLVIEAALLVAGMSLAWSARSSGWHLRAAVAGGAALAREFQIVVDALGQHPSDTFPMMALWRAAQSDSRENWIPNQTSISAIKDRLSATVDQLISDLQRYQKLEKLVESLSWIAAAVVLVALAAAAKTHRPEYKLLAILMPAVVGACHAWLWQRKISERADRERELVSTLHFVRNRLVALTWNEQTIEKKSRTEDEIVETLRFLCLCVARHTQRELELHLSSETPVPV